MAGVSVARFALDNAKVIAFATAVLALLGVRAYLTVPQSILPTMTFAKVDVVVDAGNLPPPRVRSLLALPLSAAFASLANVTRVQSTSGQGSVEFLIEFAVTTDPRADLDAVDRAIAERSPLDGATNVSAVAVDPNGEPILSYALTSKTLSTAAMREIARRSILPKLFGIPGLGRLLVTGGTTTEYHVDLDPAELVAQRLGPADVSRALKDATVVADAGARDTYARRHVGIVDASLGTQEALASVTVATASGGSVPLGALGTIALGVSPATDLASFDGRDAVVVNAYPLAGSDIVSTARDVRGRLESLAPLLPRTVALQPFWDQTSLVVASQRSLRDAIAIGALLAVVVIYAFLRDFRLTLVAAAIVPIAMAIAVFALQLAGQTLNLMSVGGLAVAVGLIIDDAIVVIEGIARIASSDPTVSPRAAIERALSTLWRPMLASTATTVVVFLPLGLLSGVAGFFFRALAFTLASSLVVSLLLALFVAPNIALALAGKHRQERRRADDVTRRYDAVLAWALHHRGTVGIGSVAILVVTAALLATRTTDFLPRLDEGQFEIAYAMPPGTTLAATGATAREMERIVSADPAVASVGRLTGIDSNGYSPTPQNKGLLRVALRPPDAREVYEAVADRMRDRLQRFAPSATFDFHQILEDLIDGLSGTPAPIEIALKGPDLRTLDELAAHLADALTHVAGVADAASGVTYDSPTTRIATRSGRIAELGLTPADVGDAIAASSGGNVATDVNGAFAPIPVRVTVAGGSKKPFGESTIYPKGTPLALSDVADVSTLTLVPEENDEDGVRTVRVTANVSGGDLSTIAARVAALVRLERLPPGYSAEIGGQSALAAASFREFASVIAIAIVLVFSVMLATFRSFRLPVVILAAIPLATIGVALALAVTRTPLDVSSFMGLLLLVGIVVKNGILLIDVANVRRASGDDVERALVAAGNVRLRPILMTTCAAIGGLLPLAFGIGQGSEMEKPLAIAVIGGLSTATIFTLVVIPVLYAALAGVRETSQT